MAETTAAVADVLAELALLEDPNMRSVNERHGDDHGVNLSKLRALAKSRGADPTLARELWSAGDTAAQLVAILVARPKNFDAPEYDSMLRTARSPKVRDWLVGYLVKKSPAAEELRESWFSDQDPLVSAAGWDLTSERVSKRPEGLDLSGLLDTIESEMRQAPERLQWAMNTCLVQIGIAHPEHRARAQRNPTPCSGRTATASGTSHEPPPAGPPR